MQEDDKYGCSGFFQSIFQESRKKTTEIHEKRMPEDGIKVALAFFSLLSGVWEKNHGMTRKSTEKECRKTVLRLFGLFSIHFSGVKEKNHGTHGTHGKRMPEDGKYGCSGFFLFISQECWKKTTDHTEKEWLEDDKYGCSGFFLLISQESRKKTTEHTDHTEKECRETVLRLLWRFSIHFSGVLEKNHGTHGPHGKRMPEYGIKVVLVFVIRSLRI